MKTNEKTKGAQEWLKVFWKKSGGVVVITKTSSALSRWVLSKNLGSHIGAQTSTMPFNTHHDDRLIHRESARERQKPDNEAENALHYKTLGRSSLKRSCLRLWKFSSLLSKLF